MSLGSRRSRGRSEVPYLTVLPLVNPFMCATIFVQIEAGRSPAKRPLSDDSDYHRDDRTADASAGSSPAQSLTRANHIRKVFR